MKISVVVTTYNWPQALTRVLQGLFQQTDDNFEILVADDGSRAETRTLIDQLRFVSPVPLRHVWQEDLGFRAAAIRNQASLEASGEYLIFLDGDCVPRKDFIKHHRALAAPKYFVVGNRILLTQEFTARVLKDAMPIETWSWGQWCKVYLQSACNRILPLISLPLGGLRLINPKKWRGAKGCNLAMYKADLMRVLGWDETFSGWGYEDSDLVIRLIRANVKRKSGRFKVPVIHLWHPERDRSKAAENWQRFLKVKDQNRIYAEKGLAPQHNIQASSLKDPIGGHNGISF